MASTFRASLRDNVNLIPPVTPTQRLSSVHPHFLSYRSVTKKCLIFWVFSSLLKLLLSPAYRSTDYEVHRHWKALTHSLNFSEWYTDKSSEWSLDYPPFFAFWEWMMGVVGGWVDPGMLEISSHKYSSWDSLLFMRCSVVFWDIVLIASVAYWLVVKNRDTTSSVEEENEVVLNTSESKTTQWQQGSPSGVSAVSSSKIEDVTDLKTEPGEAEETADLLRLLNSWVLVPFRDALGILASPSSSGVSSKKLIGSLCITVLGAGLVIVDNIHFQYNSFLIGLLIFSVAFAEGGKPNLAAFVFTTLVCFKHIFAYVGPVYLIWLSRSYCKVGMNGCDWGKVFNLGAIVLAVLSICASPVILTGQSIACISRLFPFGRGLTHAYWAPNIWAIYSAADRVIGRLFGEESSLSGISSTSGLVGITANLILPEISPLFTLFVTMLFYSPIAVLLWQNPTRVGLGVWVAAGGLAVFLSGWHVHEKAILPVLIPLALEALNDRFEKRIYLRFSIIGVVSLLPLLPGANELVLKWLILVGGLLIEDHFFNEQSESQNRSISLSYFSWRKIYILVGFYTSMGHFLLFSGYAFLPLMLTSVACALGNFWCYLSLVRFIYRNVGRKEKSM